MTNWILCPVRNNIHLTKKAVASFLDQDLGDVVVLLINNASTDGTKEWAWSLYPKVTGFHLTTPVSVAESWNKGLRLLFREGVEHVLVVNNDVELRPDTYRLLLESDLQFVTAVGVNSREQMADSDPAVTRPNPDFSCFLIRREVWNKVGEFDTWFKGAFCEDWDYHARLHKAGIDAFCIDVPFYHVGSATINNMTPEEVEVLQKQADLNREYFKLKHGFAGGTQEYYDFFKHPFAGNAH